MKWYPMLTKDLYRMYGHVHDRDEVVEENLAKLAGLETIIAILKVKAVYAKDKAEIVTTNVAIESLTKEANKATEIVSAILTNIGLQEEK